MNTHLFNDFIIYISPDTLGRIYDDQDGALGHASTTADAKSPSFEVNLAKNRDSGANELVYSFFHELVHAAQKGGNTYSHTDIAKRAYEVGVEMGFVPASAKPKSGLVAGNIGAQFEMDQTHSQQFDVYLINACSPDIKNWTDFGRFK